jgi:hypothetical protein
MSDRLRQAIYRARQDHRPSQITSLQTTARELADFVEQTLNDVTTLVGEKEKLLDVMRAAGFSEDEIARTNHVITTAYEDTFRDRRKGGAS